VMPEVPLEASTTLQEFRSLAQVSSLPDPANGNLKILEHQKAFPGRERDGTPSESSSTGIIVSNTSCMAGRSAPGLAVTMLRGGPRSHTAPESILTCAPSHEEN
jgi:hypothetical protein